MHNGLVLNFNWHLEIRNAEVFLFAYTTLIMTFYGEITFKYMHKDFLSPTPPISIFS